MDTLPQLRFLSSKFFTLPRGSKKPTQANWQNTAVPFEKLQPGDKNIATVCGLDLIVLDVEGPKKVGSVDGTQKLPSLEEGLGRLPMAPQYHTPSGGLGIIFRNPGRAVPKCDLGRTYGIEMRTGNHFCILPPSSYEGEHYSGSYEWEVTPEDVVASEGAIPTLPEEWIAWFIEMTCKEPLVFAGEAQVTPEGYDDNVMSWLWDIDADMPYNDWWQVMAIVYRMTDKTAARKLFLDWSKENAKDKWKGDTTLAQIRKLWADMPKREAERISRGESMVGLSRLLALSEAYPMHRPEPAPAPVTPLPIMSVITSEASKSVEELAKNSGSILRSLYEHMMEVAIPYPELAMGTAISILSAHVMGVYAWPTRNEPIFYNMCVLPPGGGKGDYVAFMRAYCADAKTTISGLVSDSGLKAALSEWPRRTLVEDEIGDIFDPLFRPKPSEMDVRTRGLLLQLFGAPGMIPGTQNKKKEDRIQPIINPRLGIFGVLPTRKFQNMMNNKAFIDSGMVSRITVWHPTKIRTRDSEMTHWEPKESILSDLARIAMGGKIPLEVLAGGEAPKPAPTTSITKTEGATKGFIAFNAEMNRKLEALNDDDLDTVGQLFSRARESQYRFAYIRCISRKSSEVTADDVSWGVEMARFHLAASLERMNWQDEEARRQDAILRHVAKVGVCNVRALQRALWQLKGMDARAVEAVCSALVVSGDLAEAKSGKKVSYSITSSAKPGNARIP